MPASPSTARAINDRLALRLLQQDGPLTATQLKTLTGLSRPTVADLVERLQDAGLVKVVGESGSDRRGPNARLYGIVADRAHLAALDVRTDSVAVVVADLLGVTLAEATLPIGSDTATEPAVEQAVALLERTARAAEPRHCTASASEPPASSTPFPANSATRQASRPGIAGWSRCSSSGCPRRSSWRTRPTWQPSPNTASVPHATATPSSCSGSATASEPPSCWTESCAAAPPAGRARSDSCRYPAPAGCPRHSTATAATTRWPTSVAVCELAADHGIKAQGPAGDGEQEQYLAAASVVRSALAADGPEGDAFLAALADRIALGAAAVVSVLDPGCLVLAA